MRNELLSELEKSIEILVDFQDKYDHFPEDISGIESVLQNAIEWLESLPTPDALDPYTCELMPGDLCEVIGQTSQGHFEVGEKVVVYVTSPEMVNDNGFINTPETNVYQQKRRSVLHRYDLKLHARNGATIKE